MRYYVCLEISVTSDVDIFPKHYFLAYFVFIIAMYNENQVDCMMAKKLMNQPTTEATLCLCKNHVI